MSGLVKTFISPLGNALGLFGKPKAATPATPIVVDQAAAADAANAANADDLRKRQGAAATALTGPGGAEASTPGAKTLLGQ